MLKAIVACFTLLAIPVASQPAPHKPASLVQNKSTQGSELGDKVTALEKRVTSLETSVTFYKYLIEQKQDKQDAILLDPSSRAFWRLDTDTSTFLVSLEDASPYLNGYRIKLSIGNPTEAKFSNAKLKVRWAHAYKSTDSYDEWQKSIHEKTTGLTDELQPGTWNVVTIDLLPCDANELGYLEMSMQTPTIILKQPPR